MILKVLLVFDPKPKYTEQVLLVSLNISKDSSIVLVNCKVSLKAKVHGFPNLVVYESDIFPYFSETPAYIPYPVIVPIDPAHPILAKGTDPSSVE